MYLIAIDLEYRVIIGISAMVILFTSFLISFVISHRKKLQYHKDLHVLHDEQQKILTEQNELLEKGVAQRTSELFKQKEELEKTLTHLKLAQTQLIQAEKMASLGELTAGIAHEIQNPLNFVNNFSEVSIELTDEIQEALQKDDKEEALTLASYVKDNLKKIHHHGKRADVIVKGMLQHSRPSAGKKEPVKLNALVNEYLKVTYQGLYVKDTSFSATVKTDFDESIDKIDIVPQEIGLVMLNLYNNAFYAVTQQKKARHREGFINLPNSDTYEPTVEVSTKKVGDKVEISVKDNGAGIPQKVIDKIFQPFFTTKPTGQGTGLGLSLSYDIVKAHGGEFKVESTEGEGAKFIVELPFY